MWLIPQIAGLVLTQHGETAYAYAATMMMPTESPTVFAEEPKFIPANELAFETVE